MIDNLSDDQGPIPRFPPLATDDEGRIVPVGDDEWAARSDAAGRALRRAGGLTAKITKCSMRQRAG